MAMEKGIALPGSVSAAAPAAGASSSRVPEPKQGSSGVRPWPTMKQPLFFSDGEDEDGEAEPEEAEAEEEEDEEEVEHETLE